MVMLPFLLGPKAEVAPIVMRAVFCHPYIIGRAGQISTNEPIELKLGTRLADEICSSDAKDFSNRMLTGRAMSLRS